MRLLRGLFVSLFLLSISGMVMAQDVIVKADQSTVLSKVLEITSTEIKYKKWNNLEGPTYSIVRSEVLSINYENGEVEDFSNTTTIKQQTNLQDEKRNEGYIESFASFPAALKLNGRRLSDVEIQSLLDKQNYQLYLKGKRQVNFGEIIGVIGVGALTFAYLISDPKLDDWNPVWISLAVSGVTLPPGIILSVVGARNMNTVVDNYNHNYRNYSLNIVPSFLRCDNSLSQNNYGLGLTLNLNF